MSQIKKNRIKTRLILPLKKKWFEMIKSGYKEEEYREITPYWLSIFGGITREKAKEILLKDNIETHSEKIKTMTRIEYIEYLLALNFDYDEVVFTSGYPKANDEKRRKDYKKPKIRVGYGLVKWGAEPHKVYFVITWDK